MRTELIIFRHGETDWNREHRAMGKTDIPLNEVGKQQAKKLAERLSSQHIDAIYSSPLLRAHETANTVASLHNLSVNTLDDLIEMDLGMFEGKLKTERGELFPQFDPGNDEHRILLGMDTFSNWIPKFKEQTIPVLLQTHPDQTIALSTHDQKMRALLVALGMPEQIKRTVIKNCAISAVSIEDGKPVVLFHNDASHLEK